MSFWELFAALASAASIVSLAIAVSSIFNGRATRGLGQRLHDDTLQILVRMDIHHSTLLERMDERADERQREVIEAIRTLRA